MGTNNKIKRKEKGFVVAYRQPQFTPPLSQLVSGGTLADLMDAYRYNVTGQCYPNRSVDPSEFYSVEAYSYYYRDYTANGSSIAFDFCKIAEKVMPELQEKYKLIRQSVDRGNNIVDFNSNPDDEVDYSAIELPHNQLNF